MERVYFDNAATTPLDPEVFEVMEPFLRNYYGNPSSTHSHGREVRAAIEKARKNIATHLGVSPMEIYFTSGGTEADNMAIRCAVEAMGVDTIISSPLEHHAVTHSVQRACKNFKVTCEHVRFNERGVIDLNHLEELLSEHPGCLVTLMHGNNEIANLNPLEEIGNLCRAYDALFHSDTVQTIAHYNLDLSALPVDFIAASAHKFHGPKGVGFIYVRKGVKLPPFLEGGGQERNMRGGTENIYGIVGMSKALDIALAERKTHESHIRSLKERMLIKIKEQLPEAQTNGMSGEKDSLYTVLNLSLPPVDGSELLIFNLDIENISVSGGSACSSGAAAGSHVLQALYPDQDRPSIRVSFSKYNTAGEVDYFAEKLGSFYKEKANQA